AMHGRQVDGDDAGLVPVTQNAGRLPLRARIGAVISPVQRMERRNIDEAGDARLPRLVEDIEKKADIDLAEFGFARAAIAVESGKMHDHVISGAASRQLVVAAGLHMRKQSARS